MYRISPCAQAQIIPRSEGNKFVVMASVALWVLSSSPPPTPREAYATVVIKYCTSPLGLNFKNLDGSFSLDVRHYMLIGYRAKPWLKAGGSAADGSGGGRYCGIAERRMVRREWGKGANGENVISV